MDDTSLKNTSAQSVNVQTMYILGYVHTMSTTFFIQIGLPSTLNGVFVVRKWNFLKTLSKGYKFENAG